MIAARVPRAPAVALLGLVVLAAAGLWIARSTRRLAPPVTAFHASFFEGRPAFPLRFERETRPALLAEAGRPLTRRWRVPQHASLELALALGCPEQRQCAGARTFRVEARQGGRVQVLAERRVSFDGTARWEPLSVDLAPVATATVELTLAVSAGEAVPPGTPPPRAYWADPLVVHRRQRDRPNVLLVSIDTLRADHLGCYGYARPTSPALDAFARDAVLFRQAISQAPWTTPSHLSLMTSLYPSEHGVTAPFGQLVEFLAGKSDYPSLGPGVITLADVLRAHGYETMAFTGGGTMTAEFGLARGFQAYRQDFFGVSDPPLEAMPRWLERVRDRPFFLFFHTFEVHSPYMRTEMAHDVLTQAQIDEFEAVWISASPGVDPIPALLKRWRLFNRHVTSALYDGGVRAADRYLGGIFGKLRELGLYDNTLIVILSDHGEEFGDHDPARFYDAHCSTVYDELIRVPLLMRLPGRLPAGRDVDDAVELVDVAPTVLDLLGLPIPDSMRGHSLAPLARGDARLPRRWTLSEATCTSPEIKALRGPRLKYIAAFDPAQSGGPGATLWERVFDLERNPRETRALADPEASDRLRSLLRRRLEELQAPRPASVEADPDGRAALRERLRALGYVD